MTELTNKQLLTELEQKMRLGDNDRDYLINQLMILTAVLSHVKDKDTGLGRAALGGIHYCVNRLRILWREPEAPEGKSLEELEEIYAKIELGRFAQSEVELRKAALKYKDGYVLVRAHKIEVQDRTFYLLSSAKDQTTSEGRRLTTGELLETSDPGVPNFQRVLQELQSAHQGS
ncbi:hypothetical protein LUCX_129 [Xanthomonas phage vB_XciM_LucasX]|nr:hypothetical protein LUCX_129 [Xanthomonas phage vB_XciM_LucasX]